MKIVIFGCGDAGKKCLEQYGKDAIDYFYDNFPKSEEFLGKPVINWMDLLKLKDVVNVVVAANNPDVRISIILQLREYGFRYEVFNPTKDPEVTNIIHIYSKSDSILPENIVYDVFNGSDSDSLTTRMMPTVDLFKAVFEKYGKDFDKKIDFYIYTYDSIINAYNIKRYLDKKTIFAYSTLEILKNEVIPIPDYRTCFDESIYPFPENPESCRNASNKIWEDNRIYFKGASHVSECRNYYDFLAKKYPDKICSDMRAGWRTRAETVPMTKYARYKYLMDMPGRGWTDRTKILLRLGRPIFMAERPYKEWYYDYLIPMKHYIPVKADLSDLIEKYLYLENNPTLYKEIVKNMNDFVNTYFTSNKILEYMRNMIKDHLND